MSELTRHELEPARRELREDARREYALIPQALIALAVVGVIVAVREVFFV